MDQKFLEELRLLAQVRSSKYKLLASMYAKEPPKERIVKMLDKEFLSELSRVFDEPSSLDVLQRFAGTYVDDKESYEELRSEYVRLFVVPSKGYVRPAYESVYREGLLYQQSTMAVMEMYRREGLEVSEEYKELPDYIGLELGFMHLLIERELKVWEIGSVSEALSCLNTQKDFLEQHLLKWVPDLCDEIVKNTKHEFWEGVARITKAFLVSEMDLLSNKRQITLDQLKALMPLKEMKE